MIRLSLLGSLDLVSEDGNPLPSVLAQPRRLALLAYLAAARPPGFHRRDSLLALFWPEVDEASARARLRQSLYQLRRSLGEAAIPGRGDAEVGIDPGVLWCDAAEFRRLLEEDRAEEALELYRGDLLDGFHLEDAPAWERWLSEERDHLRRAAAQAATRLGEGALERGDAAAAAVWLRRAIELSPYDETVVARLVTALAGRGDRGGALQELRSFAERLDRDLELKPSAGLRALEERLRGEAGEAPGPDEAALSAPRPAAEPTRRERRTVPARRFPMAAALLLLFALGGGAGWWAARPGPREPAPVASVAVLPFVDISPEGDQEFFSDGITEEILNALAQIEGLRVPARTSVLQFKDRPVDVREVGERLGVRAVLEGSVRTAGDRVRITAQLIDAEQGYHIWSETYDREIRDIFAVQEEIARAIAGVLRVEVGSGESRRLARRGEVDPRAHLLFLKGRFVMADRNQEAMERAVEFFRRAIEADPSYAEAHAMLARSYNLQASYGYRPEAEMLPLARAATARALELDPELPETHEALAGILVKENRWEEAAREHRRVVELLPRSAEAHHHLASILGVLDRREEQLRELREAVRLDPLSPLMNNSLGVFLYESGDYPGAIAQFTSALEVDPDHQALQENLAKAYVETGRYAEADSLIRRLSELYPPHPFTLATQADLLIRTGREAEAREVLERIKGHKNSARFLRVALVYSALGQVDSAYLWLERVDWNTTEVRQLRAHPRLAAVRADPRYPELMRRLGLRP
jgi:TolB-like protein/DNA-binding SARP family transcriptional activator